MKNKLAISLIAASVITGSAFADMANVEGLTTTKIVCENGTDGFTVEIERDGVSQVVSYSSCEQGGFVSGAAVEELTGETVYISALDSDVYFPNGYTEPIIEAGISCSGGYGVDVTPATAGLDEIEGCSIYDAGWLNTVSMDSMQLIGSGSVDSLENFANLATLNNSYFLLANNNLQDLTGLENLTTINASTLNFDNNELTNVNGLSNLVTMTGYGDLDLRNNMLTNVDGLSNLESVGTSINLTNNSLTNVDGLSNLTSVDFIYMQGNFELTDISGLSSLTSASTVFFEEGITYTDKLAADSWLCNEGSSVLKTASGAVPPEELSNYCN